jgi:hypothetical protein
VNRSWCQAGSGKRPVSYRRGVFPRRSPVLLILSAALREDSDAPTQGQLKDGQARTPNGIQGNGGGMRPLGAVG